MFTGAPVYGADNVEPTKPVEQEENTILHLGNRWIQAELNLDRGGELEQFDVGGTQFLLNSEEHKIKSLTSQSTGLKSLLLFPDDPTSSRIVSLPNHWTHSILVSEIGSATSVLIRSVTSPPFSMEKTVTIRADESILFVTTAITNKSGESQTFLPAEIPVFNAEYGVSGFPNTNFFFYSPYSPASDEDKGIRVLQEPNPQISQFKIPKDYPIFLTQYKDQNAHAKLSNNKNWIAVHDGNTGQVCAIEYRFLSKNIKPVRDNLEVITRGAVVSKKGEKNSSNDKYIKLIYILGHVTLKPGETFTYSAAWSSSKCAGPIAHTANGVVFHKPLEVKKHEFGFCLFGTMGVPQDGPAGVQFLDEKGDVIYFTVDNKKIDSTNYSVSLGLKPGDKRPAHIVADLPTVMTHIFQFPLAEDQTTGQPLLDYMIERTKTIRLIEFDRTTRKITRIVAEDHAPWEEYDGDVTLRP